MQLRRYPREEMLAQKVKVPLCLDPLESACVRIRDRGLEDRTPVFILTEQSLYVIITQSQITKQSLF